MGIQPYPPTAYLPPTNKPARSAAHHTRVQEFNAKNREIIEDARRMIDDPTVSEVTKEAARERIAELESA